MRTHWPWPLLAMYHTCPALNTKAPKAWAVAVSNLVAVFLSVKVPAPNMAKGSVFHLVPACPRANANRVTPVPAR